MSQFNDHPEAQLTVIRSGGWPTLTPPGVEGTAPNVFPSGCKVEREAAGRFLVTLDSPIGPNEINPQLTLLNDPSLGPLIPQLSKLPAASDRPISCTKLRVAIWDVEAGAYADPTPGGGFSLTVFRARVALPGQ